MVEIFVLIGCALGCVAFIVFITLRLNDGKRQIQNGRWELAKYDNWFIRIFARKKLEKGKEDLFYGEKKYALGRKIRLVCVLICVGCVIGAILVMFMSYVLS